MYNPANHNKRTKLVDVLTCDKCKNSWLTLVRVNRFTATPKQPTVEPNKVHFDGDFHVLMCVACGNFVLPPAEGFQTSTQTYQNYSEMVDELNKCAEEAKQQAKTDERSVVGAWSHIPDKNKSRQ